MTSLFEEIDYRVTPMGAISLRRRRLLSLGRDVFEVMLGEEHLMSSLFTEGEIALAEIGLAAAKAPKLDVLVGGLGLGYTAAAVLDDPRVRSLAVVEAMPAVIEWHERGLVPIGTRLAADARCSLVHDDFFAMMETPVRRRPKVDVVLLDIDHSPRSVLSPGHAAFYTAEGLRGVANQLVPGGVFALWSDTHDLDFEAVMNAAFVGSAVQRVEFDNPLTGGRSGCAIYTGRTPAL